MDFEPLLQLVQPHLPPVAFHILLNLASAASSAINTLAFALTHPSDPESVDALKSLVPSLLSVLALYFTIMSMYRTLRTTIRLVVFFVKWILILGALGAGLAYLMKGGQQDDFGDLTAHFHKVEATLKDYGAKAAGGKGEARSIWDRFDARERDDGQSKKLWWQKDKDAPPAAKSSAIDYVFEQVASYKWVVDALLDTKEDDAPERGSRPGRTKAKPRTNPKPKAGQRVR
ncbi:hypothetical protein BDV93DRAFT_604800 [Ceratobasidium sp. AG-I]|nr:hypothetical protein BDV93DRAFT_604800 [Ceratobasidium sp. AG-I]